MRHLFGFLACAALALSSGLLGSNAGASGNSFYVGLQSGGAWGESDFAFPDFGGKTVPIDTDGIVFGAHAGVQHDFDQFFVGAEASIAFTDISGGNITPGGVSCSSTVAPANRVLCRVTEVESLTMAVLRAGFTSGTWSFYATGGYAGAEISTDGIILASGIGTIQDQQWHDGWTYGLGVDYRIAPQWTLGVEYKRVDLDGERHAQSFGAGNRHDTDLELDLIQAKLSYHFGG